MLGPKVLRFGLLQALVVFVLLRAAEVLCGSAHLAQFGPHEQFVDGLVLAGATENLGISRIIQQGMGKAIVIKKVMQFSQQR